MEVFWVLFSMFGSLLLMVIFPVPWVVGIVTIIKWLANRNKNKQASVVPQPLSQAVASSYNESAPPPIPVSENPEPLINSENLERIEATVPAPHKEQFNSLNNINVFLYIGAFLVVIASTVFIGAAYTELSGVFKTWFLACFAAVFYGLGIWFYLKFPVVKPAGLTFATIGLVLAPIVGLAYFSYINQGQSGEVVWFVTSLFVFGLYFLSLKLLKKAYVAYFLNLVSLSLFESFISLFQAPMYYFGWGMALASMLFLLISKQSRDEEMKKSFYYSSNIFLPISLFLSLQQTMDFGWTQFGINSILAAVYYLIATFLSDKITNKTIYYSLSLILLPLGLLSWLLDASVDRNIIIGTLSFVGLAYIIIYEATKKIWTDNRPKVTLVAGSILATLVALLYPSEAGFQLGVIFYALALNSYALVREKLQINYILTAMNFLFIPSVFLRLIDKVQPDYITMIYLGFGLLAVLVRAKIVAWLASLKWISIVTYTLCFLISFFSLFTVANATFSMVSILLLAVIALAISQIEEQDWILIIFSFLIYLGFIQTIEIWNLASVYYVYIFAAIGTVLYLVGYSLKDTRSKILSYCGLVGPFAGAVFGVPLTGNFMLAPIFSLLLAGGLLYLQAKKEKSDAAEYFAYGCVVVSFEWWLNFMKVTELQVYMVINSAYFATLAYLRHLKQEKHSVDILTYVALGFLTIPMYFQVWGIEKERLTRGIIFFGESLALIFLGMGIKYQVVRRWGIGSLIAGVLIAYYSIWFLVGLIGIGLLVFAIIMLTKSAKQQNPPPAPPQSQI